MSFTEPTRPSAAVSTSDLSARRQFYGSALARYVRRRRTELGMTIEQAAKLAGMQMSEWLSLEAGWVPQSSELWPVAEVLETRNAQIVFLALISRCSYEAAEAELS
jgi:transcriptional regulator with XRE-family HTH domain